MKIRFSKTLAAILAATTLTAISGISAMASVVTHVTYDAENYEYGKDNAVTVTSTVTAGANQSGQVTYLVATATPSAAGAIKYIDQAPIEAGGDATFTFTTTENAIYATDVVSAKFGSDCGVGVDSFAFKEGVDRFNDGDATPVFTNVVEAYRGVLIYGSISGNPSEYGIKIGNIKYKALGTVGGVFCVALNGATLADVNGAKAYAIKADGTTLVESATAYTYSAE